MTTKQSESVYPIFDAIEYFDVRGSLPKHLGEFSSYSKDYECAHAFLSAYKGNGATFNAYRREIERLLHWSWLIAHTSAIALKRTDIETYLHFCQHPPKAWVGIKKVPHFMDKDGERIPNPEWRPFVATVKKSASKQGKLPDTDHYQLSEKALKDVFSILSSFYQFLIRENYAEINPVAQIRQKSKFFRKYQSSRQIRRLSELQWDYVIETAKQMAEQDPENHERTFFIMTALYGMYLRVSELVASERWSPKMNSFKRDHDGHWWFVVVGKGNKERQIAVSQVMLEALKRWRGFLGLSALPSPDDQTPLIPKNRGPGSIASTNQIRNIVQTCFDRAVTRMKQEGLGDESTELETATVHWLRHTGISDDVKRRPREHVRDDAGHSSSAITDRYIDVGLRERHESAQNKPLKSD